ncbi:MAG: 30S ribosomal protein S20 [Acidimicrobiia bacterium]|nr:30S ribosomal protein S20 [Acidimicrobiia bacterium]
MIEKFRIRDSSITPFLRDFDQRIHALKACARSSQILHGLCLARPDPLLALGRGKYQIAKKAHHHKPAGTPENQEALRLAVKRLDKAAAKRTIHPKQAARRKSRLMRKLNAASAK